MLKLWLFITFVAKDVIRTDRDHPYFHGECNEHLDRLQDILLTHIMFDFDLGEFCETPTTAEFV